MILITKFSTLALDLTHNILDYHPVFYYHYRINHVLIQSLKIWFDNVNRFIKHVETQTHSTILASSFLSKLLRTSIVWSSIYDSYENILRYRDPSFQQWAHSPNSYGNNIAVKIDGFKPLFHFNSMIDYNYELIVLPELPPYKHSFWYDFEILMIPPILLDN